MEQLTSVEMFDVGFGNAVPKRRVTAIVAHDSDPVHRFCDDMEKAQRAIDATKGRKVRSVIFLDSGQIVLSSVARETLWERLQGSPPILGDDDLVSKK